MGTAPGGVFAAAEIVTRQVPGPAGSIFSTNIPFL